MTTRPCDSGADPADAAVSRHRLGTRLRQLRQARDLRLADVAAELGIAGSTLSRIETGRAPARASYLRVLLDLYHVSDPRLRQEYTELALHGQHDDWAAGAADLLPAETLRYLGLEAAAAHIRVLGTSFIPGLLQTPGYAAAAWHAARPGISRHQAGRLAAITEQRQKCLTGRERSLHAVIDEAALLRPVGPPPVFTAQLDHIARLAATSLTIQVLPLGTPWPVLGGSFTLLAFTSPDDPDTACTPGADGLAAVTSHPAIVSRLDAAFTALAQAALPPDESARLFTLLARRPDPIDTQAGTRSTPC